jgi:predicted GH43/DUF377 family glycosyl hydrolase
LEFGAQFGEVVGAALPLFLDGARLVAQQSEGEHDERGEEVLIYNGSNAANFNEPGLPKFTYSAGQALYDKEKPFMLIDRMKDHFIHPDKPYEKTGEVNEVCFVEGLVHFQGKWFLYYGTADSRIAVAVKKE